jgi:signal transduction histidine kinase
MSTHQVINSLHFRMAILFLVLLSVMFVGYTKWVDHTLYSVSWAPGEEEWYNEFQDTELDSIATLIAPHLGETSFLDASIAKYGTIIHEFDAEIAVVAEDGEVLITSAPPSLSTTLISISPTLLDSMSTEEWDFTSYPNMYNIDAYENRITSVVPLYADGDTLAAADGWLISTFRPVNADFEDTKNDDRVRLIQGAAVILVYSLVIGLVLLAWVSRRIRRLALDMNSFREGDFSRRTNLSGSDEIASLGHGFNRLADRLSTVITELQQSEEYRSQLVANISHDLRTPMATLRSYVESFMLHWDKLEAKDRDRQLTTITSNLDNLESLIERLFDLTQLESGQVDFRPEVFPLEELADDILRQLEVKADAQGIKLELEVEGKLELVKADPLRIGQVLQNLVDNAVRHSLEGGQVVLKLAKIERGIMVSVSDSGTGISEEDLPHVFERFYTADKSRTGRNHGSGLGLAIAHRIITAHGGELTVESRQGSGTCFRFNLSA